MYGFSLGLATEDRVPAKVRDKAGDSVALGMSVLLRYLRVCFSWADATLHLGGLGPCAKGEAPFAAALSSRGQPFVNVGLGDGDEEPLRVLVDTGAPETDCQDRFMRRMGDDVFSFGDHPQLVARCGDDSPSLQTAPWIDAVIGMDDLAQFDAIGWELNPFRMYFVPKRAIGGPRASGLRDAASIAQATAGERSNETTRGR